MSEMVHADTGQGQLVFPEYAVPRRAGSISERWLAVKAANPWLVDEFLRMAVRARGRGHGRFGVKWLVEIYRWERSAAAAPGDRGFRFNNDFTALLARDLIAADPSLSDVIVTRERKAA